MTSGEDKPKEEPRRESPWAPGEVFAYHKPGVWEYCLVGTIEDAIRDNPAVYTRYGKAAKNG